MRVSPNVANSLLTMMGVGLAASIMPASAFAQLQKPQYACYVPGSGTVYRVKEASTPAQCSTGHVEFQISTGSSTQSGSVAAAAGGGGSLPTNDAGAYDFSNVNGLVSTGTWGTGALPVSGSGTRLMWYPRMAALRAGLVDGTQWDNVNIGSGSVAVGHNTRAGGQYAFAAGTNSIANGNASVAMGDQSTALEGAASALGYKAKAHGFASVALGHEATATAYNSVAIGRWSQATDNYAMAIGGTATGNQAIAIGPTAVASGIAAMAIGHHSDASGNSSMALGSNAYTNGKTGAFVYGDFSSSDDVKAAANNQFVVRAQKFWLGTNTAVTATAGRFLETSTGAYLSAGGAWVSSSDSSKKHRWEDVEGEAVLLQLAGMPVRRWSYREEGDSVRHMGPSAQDFRTAFGLGDTDKAIATVDADGVSLAAIKALVQRTTELRRENEELRAVLAEVHRRLAELEVARR
jgi:hypothetical protein